MLKRILEPEVMESHQEATAYDRMDHHAVNTQFVRDLIVAGCPARATVLDLGSGTAMIPINLCQAMPAINVVGVDLSDEMLLLAKSNIIASRLAQRIQIEKLDAKGLPFQTGEFDVCLSNSVVHHIPCPEDIFVQAVRVTRTDGLLFLRDLLRPESVGELQHLVQMYADQENERQQRLFSDSLHAALSLREVQNVVANLGYDPAGVRRTSDRHWTWSARK